MTTTKYARFPEPQMLATAHVEDVRWLLDHPDLMLASYERKPITPALRTAVARLAAQVPDTVAGSQALINVRIARKLYDRGRALLLAG